tara:strand:+ start:13878 stop:14420 length:543 start_codon:yes stop_codon:yes gene_type:complete
MAETTIITKADIQVLWSNLDKNFTEAKLSPYILRSQQTELKTLLGDSLYYDFVSNITIQKYIDLLDGVEYSYQGNTIFFGGVKPYLAALSFGRIISNINVSVGTASVTDKATEQSTPHDNAIIQTRGREAKSEALRLQSELLQFLDEKRSTYPLFQSRESSEQDHDTSMKITSVPRHRQR